MIQINGKLKILVTFTTLSFLVSSGLPTFVMQAVNNYHASHSAAGSLESYTNLTQVLASFVMFSVLLKLGFKRSVLIGAGILFTACAVLPLLNNIWSIRLYLIASGLTFVALKIVAYSSVALVVKNEKEHASFINLMEAFFTAGCIAGMWLFAFFVGAFPEHWIRILWVFGLLCLLLILMWAVSPFDEREIQKQEEKPLKDQFKAIGGILHLSTLLFVVLVFAYESLEQGVGSWLPSFNNEILKLPDALCIKIASLFTVGMAIGRLIGALALKRIPWYKLFFINFSLGLALLVLFIPNIKEGLGAHADSLFHAPLIAFGIPLLGVFIGPVYPTLMSCILESNPSYLHPVVMSLAMLVTPFSDSLSSKILGLMFGSLGGIKAFTLATFIPMILLLILFYPFQRARMSRAQPAGSN
jgi:FHS family glucose/mannose:H+ symporter-like MFS transporter